MAALDDPRVFFAAERTLMAWNRTALTLMTFGFVVERFGLFLQVQSGHAGHDASFWLGLCFIALAVLALLHSVVQYRRVVRGLGPGEIPAGYSVAGGIVLNLVVAAAGVALLVFLGGRL